MAFSLLLTFFKLHTLFITCFVQTQKPIMLADFKYLVTTFWSRAYLRDLFLNIELLKLLLTGEIVNF